MASTQTRIIDALAPTAVPADPPGAPMRTHFMQVPSDALRDHARTFVKALVALVPDPEFHDHAIDFVHDIVVAGERRLEHALETRDDFKRDGFKLRVPHRDYRSAPFKALAEIERVLHQVKDGNEAQAKAESTGEAGATQQPTQQPTSPRTSAAAGSGAADANGSSAAGAGSTAG